MKTDGAPLHGSYFDLLEAKHPDLGPTTTKVQRSSRPRPVRRRTGPLLVVAIGALVGVVWLAIALRPASDVASAAEAIQAPVEAVRDLESSRPEVAVAETPPAPVVADAEPPRLESPRLESAAPRPVPEPRRSEPAVGPPLSEPSPSEPAQPVAASEPAVAAAPAEPPAALLPARAISSPPPVYPEAARLAAEEGTVVVEAEVDVAGVVRNATVVRGRSPALDRAAVEALGKWRFEPATRGGVTVASSRRVSFKFTLQPQSSPGAGAGAAETTEPRVPLQVGGEVQPPRRLAAPLPVYPDAAWAAGITGDVLVRAVIDETGAVTDVEVLRGLPYGITEAAVAAIWRWKFAPATRDGQPVAVYRNLSVRFDT